MSTDDQHVADGLCLQRALDVYKAHVIAAIGRTIPEVPTGEDLWVLAARAVDRGTLADGWTTDTPFPGRAAAPAPFPGGWMMSAAVNVSRDGRPIGYIMTTLATGRAPALVFLRFPFDAPATWKPVAGAGTAAAPG